MPFFRLAVPKDQPELPVFHLLAKPPLGWFWDVEENHFHDTSQGSSNKLQASYWLSVAEI